MDKSANQATAPLEDVGPYHSAGEGDKNERLGDGKKDGHERSKSFKFLQAHDRQINQDLEGTRRFENVRRAAQCVGLRKASDGQGVSIQYISD